MNKIVLIGASIMFSVLSIGNSQAENPSGTCGTNCNWIIENGVLKITGGENGVAGEMDEYSEIYDEENDTYYYNRPWNGYENIVNTLEISGVRDIPEYAFGDFNNVKKIIIGESVESAYSAFPRSGVETIDLSNATIKVLDEENLNLDNHPDLKTVILGDSVTTLGNNVLQGNPNLETVIIPDSVTSVSEWAFDAYIEDLDQLKIVCKGSAESCATLKKQLAENMEYYNNGKFEKLKNVLDITKQFFLANESQCTGNYAWNGANCVKKDDEGNVACASGFVEWDKQCLSEYPFAKKRWTPTEANEWLHDGNDNFVIITFKK